MATGKLICITGGRGSGKTVALATLPPPDEMDKVFVIDCENSWSDVLKQVKPGYYLNAYERFGMGDRLLHAIAKGDLPWVSKNKSSLVEFYEWFVNEMDKKLVNGRFKYLLIDTVEPIETTMTAAVNEGKMKFGWQGSKAYGRMETEGVRPLYENLLQSFYERGVEVVGIATHIKYVWMDDRPILNKIKPGGRLAVLSRLSSLMLWLVQGGENEDGAPAALVLKARMGKMVPTDKGWQVHRVLPRRIPHFTWMDVDRYTEYPANLASPAPGEKPTAAELQMIDEMLTDEQMKLMVLGAEIERDLGKQSSVLGAVEVELSEEVMGQIGVMHAQGKPLPLIARTLDLSLPKVREVIAGLQAEMGM